MTAIRHIDTRIVPIIYFSRDFHYDRRPAPLPEQAPPRLSFGLDPGNAEVSGERPAAERSDINLEETLGHYPLPGERGPAQPAPVRAGRRAHLAGGEPYAAPARRRHVRAAQGADLVGGPATGTPNSHAHGLCLRHAGRRTGAQDTRHQRTGRCLRGRAATAHARGLCAGRTGTARVRRTGQRLLRRIPVAQRLGGRGARAGLRRGGPPGVLDDDRLCLGLYQRFHGALHPVQGSRVCRHRLRALPHRRQARRGMARRGRTETVLRGRLDRRPPARTARRDRGNAPHDRLSAPNRRSHR